MAYQNTTATDHKDLMSVIKAFAVAQGWTVNYDDIAAVGQMGISKGNCKLTMGVVPSENPVLRTDAVNGGTVNDAYLYMVVNHSITGSLHQFWGHPSSIVSSNTDPDRVRLNDVYGPFTNVWLFSNASGTYIHVVTQQGGDRFNVFSFGVLDKKGMTHPDVGYCVGCDYIWWPDFADVSNFQSDFNQPGSLNHFVGFLGELNTIMCFIPDTVVDPALGFTDGDFQTPNTPSIYQIMSRGWQAADHQSAVQAGRPLDYFLTVDNQVVTGGILLSSLDVRYRQNDLAVMLGQFPDIRFVNMESLNPGQEITLASDTWKCFPLKRKGSRQDTNQGANPRPFVNSIEYGFAIKKIT